MGARCQNILHVSSAGGSLAERGVCTEGIILKVLPLTSNRDLEAVGIGFQVGV